MKHHHGVVYYIVFAGWEWWLGKTEKIKSSSTVELVIDSVKYLKTKFTKEKK